MIAELFDAMLDAGFNPPQYAQAGEVVRFSTGDGKQNKNGWLLIFMDGKGAVFGDWRTDSKFTWFEKGVVQSSPETVEQRNAAMLKAAQEREERYKSAALESQSIYDDAITCESHAYLERKGVSTCNGLRIGLDGRLIVPVFNHDEKIQSLQFIDKDGNKRFLTDGKMKGGCFVIGELERGKKAFMCEGLATGLTIFEATKTPVIVAFNAGNMKTVFESFKNDVTITICADNDTHGKGEQAAKDCGCDYVMPPTHGDFNDFGVDATRELLGTNDNNDDCLFISVAELMAMDFKTNWLIKGFVEKGGLGMVYGESGAGKSLFTLDWAYCVATGTNWHGFKVKQPEKVMYIAGEGSRGFKMRLAALNQKYNSKIKDNLVFSKQSFNFLDKKAAKTIIDQVERMEFKPSLIFVDTLHRNMIGDENKAEDMGQFLATIEILVKKYGCAVVIVHHSGIIDKGRARGSSATQAGMDFVFCITKGNDFETTISCVKMKDADKPAPLKFLIHKVELDGSEWFDEDEGKQVTGVHLVYQGIDTEREQKLSRRDEIALETLKTAIGDKGKINVNELLVVGVGNVKVIHAEDYREYFNSTCKGKNKTRDFDESLKSLVNRRYVGRDGSYLWLIED